MQQSWTEKNWTANPPSPAKLGMKPRKSQNAPFYHLWFGGDGGGGKGLNFASVLSKIVVVLMMYDFTVFEKLRFRPSTRKQKAGDFKTLQLLTISNFKNTPIRVSGWGLRIICHLWDMLCISVQPIWRDVCV